MQSVKKKNEGIKRQLTVWKIKGVKECGIWELESFIQMVGDGHQNVSGGIRNAY